jgi:branched-subunit amino acid transport protein
MTPLLTTSEMLLILGMTIVTFGVRYPVMLLVGRMQLPQSVFRALRFVPPAVLTAIIVPTVFMPQGSIDLSLNNTYLVASLVAALVAWRTRSLLLTIVIGMAAMLLLRAVQGALPI